MGTRAAIAAVILVAGCTDSHGIIGSDAGDAGDADLAGDPPIPCTYPAGPYAFNEVGDTVPPCAWPSAVSSRPESLPADLEALYCDPGVESIFIFVGASYDANTASRLEEIVPFWDHYATYGAKWIWILMDAPSDSAADEYLDEVGVGFGWATNDAASTLGAHYFASTPMLTAIPWIGVIDAETMQVVYDDPSNIYSIVLTLGTD
jgi:hypothetical protein